MAPFTFAPAHRELWLTLTVEGRDFLRRPVGLRFSVIGPPLRVPILAEFDVAVEKEIFRVGHRRVGTDVFAMDPRDIRVFDMLAGQAKIIKPSGAVAKFHA